MTVINPPGFLQNAGNVHTAEVIREIANLVGGTGALSAASLKSRGGVNSGLGGGLIVTQNGTPNMTVNVASGTAAVPGSEGAKQGLYTVLNDATVNIPIDTADPTNPRIDLVVFRVQDSFYSGAPNTSLLQKVTGTPAGSPSPPATPANSVVLAHVSVPANDTAITNAQITDKRPFLTASGGIVPYTTANAPTFTLWPAGTFFVNITTKRLDYWDGVTLLDVSATMGLNGATAVQDIDNTSRTTTTTGVFTGVLSGSAAVECGVAFKAPTSGKVSIHWACELLNTGANFTLASIAVRQGTVVGSGTSVLASSQDNTVRNDSATGHRYGVSYLLTGLTPGADYNVAMEHQVQAGTGTFSRRLVKVSPEF